MGDPVRLGEVLDAVGRRLGLGAPVQVGRIWRAWPEIVGDAMADHVEPTSLRAGVLRVRTESPAWANEMGYLSDEIRRRVNGFLREEAVVEVRVWTGPGRIRRRQDDSGKAAPREATDRSEPGATRHPREALERARAAWARRGSGRR